MITNNTEATCRLVNTSGKEWAKWPAERQAQIIRLATIQQGFADAGKGGKNWSDKDFTSGLDIAPVWPSIRTGSYPYPAQPRTRAKWHNALDALELHANTELLRADSGQPRSLHVHTSDPFIKFSEYHAIVKAIGKSKAKTTARTEERLVVFKARTRGGKTWLADQLAEEGQVNWRVEASPSWAKSYKAMLMSLCDMFGVARARKADAVTMEGDIIAHIRTLSGVVLFEEVQDLCALSQQFIKMLLNKSGLVVCIFVTNEAHAEMLLHGGNHLAQLLARAETTITAGKLTADHVRQFDPLLWSLAESDALPARVADAANALGALSCIRRVTASVWKLLKGGPAVTDDMVTSAIASYRRDVPMVDTTTRPRRGRPMIERRAA